MDPTQCVAGNYLMKSLFIQTISLFVITGYPQIDKIPCVYTVSDQLATHLHGKNSEFASYCHLTS